MSFMGDWFILAVFSIFVQKCLHLTSLSIGRVHFQILGVSYLICFEQIILLANTEDPEQRPRSAASDLGLRCLPMSQKWDARLIWV